MSTNLSQLPKDLPVPVDDGAVAHLPGSVLPDISLPGTDGSTVSLAGLRERWVIYIKRLTLIAHDGRIEKVFYPVFPPDQNADEVLAWLASEKKK